MSLSDAVTLEVEGIDGPIGVHRMEGVERLHDTYAFDVILSTEGSGTDRAALSLADVIAKPATLAWEIHDGQRRAVEGVVAEATALRTGYSLRIVPSLALLAQTTDHRVLVDRDALQIVEEVLSEHDISVERRARRTPAVRAQCVQAFESDLAFVTRLLAEEGYAYYLPLDRAGAIVVTDQPSGFDDVPGLDEIPEREAGGVLGAESIFRARVRQSVVTDKLTLRDYNFEKPELDLTASTGVGDQTLEVYEYPGFYAEPSLGTDLAAVRLEQIRARRVVLTGETTSRRFSPGYVITIASERRPRLAGKWLITEVRHALSDRGGEGDQRYVARFTATPVDTGHRPARPAPPRLGGIETATVTGASGSEIHTEPYGRVKVLHRWDRRGKPDDTASSWLRVVQPPTSGGFLQPRVGWETLVAFYERRSADSPLLVGRLYNGEAVPPGKAVATALGTRTTPGGGSANVIQLDDSAGSEAMSFNASKDLNERTENDKNTEVTANDTWTVGANRTIIVGQVLNQAVDGAQSYSIGATRTVNVTSNKMVNAASETVMVGGLRTFNIGGDLTTKCSVLTRLVGAAKAELGIEQCSRAVQGASTTLVGGSWSQLAGASLMQNVSGASTELVGGAKSVRAPSFTLSVRGAYNETLASRTVQAGGDREEGFGAAAAYTIGSSATIKGANVVVKATGRIAIQAGGVSITITPGSVTVSGTFKGTVACKDQGEIDYG